MKQKWDSPSDWLEEAIDDQRISANDLVYFVINQVRDDLIEAEFESYMKDDGYFEEYRDDPCKKCGDEWVEIYTSYENDGIVYCEDCLLEALK